MNLDDLHTSAAVADRFAVDEAQLLRWRRQHEWPCVKIGRKVYFTEDQIAEITRRQTIAAGKVTPADGRTARSASRRRRA